MSHKTTIQTDFVVDTSVATQLLMESENHSARDLVFKLVDLAAFIKLFKQAYPKSVEDPKQIWHDLFGNAPDGCEPGINKECRYLTEDSCGKILQHFSLFNSGIDFNYLPSGFFIAKNPNSGGVRDVLHYSDFLAKNKPQTNPFAIVLSYKAPINSLKEGNDFYGSQASWYDYLLGKMQSYCTEQELRNAFIAFTNTLTKLNLGFTEVNRRDFIDENINFNPIVMLARWNAILTQPNLKKEDVAKQFAVLPGLVLSSGYGALRAITDYKSTKNPCGFVLPDMFPYNCSDYPVRRSQMIFHDIYHPDITDYTLLRNFWIYLAYQPQRNSVDYYEKGLHKVATMEDSDIMLQILAESSTGTAHFATTTEEEQKEYATWLLFCDVIDTFETSSIIIKSIVTTLGNSESIRKDVLQNHLARIKPTPSVTFLHSIALVIQKHIADATLFSIGASLTRTGELLSDLGDIYRRVQTLLGIYGAAFYAGAKFYFVGGEWKQLNLEDYINLQYRLDVMAVFTNKSYIARAIIPNLSTFNIVTFADIYEIFKAANIANVRADDLEFCLEIFKDATKQCSKESLIKIINIRKDNLLPSAKDLELLEKLELLFKPVFVDGYFEKKRIQMLDARLGLNKRQVVMVQQLPFSEKQKDSLILIESALVRNNSLINDVMLVDLNENLVGLSDLVSETDFTEFLEQIVSIKEQLPLEIATLNSLIILLKSQRRLTDFRQIYFRNVIESCADRSLIGKFIIFIEKVKPHARALGSISIAAVQELLASMVLNTDLSEIDSDKFLSELDRIMNVTEMVVMAHPHLLQHLNEALGNVHSKNSKEYFNNVMSFINGIAKLNQLFPSGDDEDSRQNMLNIHALLANFHDTPSKLVEILELLNTLALPQQQKFILIMICNLIQNQQAQQDIGEVSKLIKTLANNASLFSLLEQCCAMPPYPSIQKINAWLESGNFEEYASFCIQPYGTRYLDFAYKPEEVKSQRSLFKGLDADLFSDELSLQIEILLRKNRTADVNTLREIFQGLRATEQPLNNQQKLEMLCICIEMLARTTWQQNSDIPPKQISQELNTTQAMALYAMLTNPNSKLISEIATGEGKSRISMILAACQVCQGKTVDFITSDMLLAERDYLSYSAFFYSLRIRASLVTLTTPKQLYQKNGVNFSDNSQLLLLRNRSDVMLDRFAYLVEDPSQRCVIIDEVDKFMHDKAKDSYNYASASISLKGFVWIYPLLVDFVQERIDSDLAASFNAEAETDNFVQYVVTHDLDELHHAATAALNQSHKNQLVSWLNSSHTALHLKIDSDYKTTEAEDKKLIRVQDSEGFTRYTRKILVLDNGRPVDGSSFALGVHQCLCALENKRSGKKDVFVILPENETQRSSYPINFMAQYDNGAILGVSGTTRHEAPMANSKINYEDYSYMVVPRHRKLLRTDKNIWLSKDEKQQIEFIKRSLREKLILTPKRPILLICRDDIQSKKIYDALISDASFGSLVNMCTRVHGLIERTDEINAIKTAGKPGNITISTVGMFGRGVDINAENLYVVSAYVPTFEDEMQIKGRTARAGKPGEYRMIPNMSDLECPINGKTYNIDNEVDKIQKDLALRAINQQEIAKLYAEFLEKMHQNFLLSLAATPKIEQLELLEKWQKYLNKLQKDWDLQRSVLLVCMEHGKQQEFTTVFNAFVKNCEDTSPFNYNEAIHHRFSLEKVATVFDAVRNYKDFLQHERKPIKTQRDYDVGDDGQARVYTTFFAKERATLRGERAWFADIRAWREGRGAAFPNLMATLRGERAIFADLRATIARLIREFREWVNEKFGRTESPKEVVDTRNAESVHVSRNKFSDENMPSNLSRGIRHKVVPV